MLGVWRSGNFASNPELPFFLSQPWDMYAVYKQLRRAAVPALVDGNTFDRMFVGHGFFFDQDGRRYWDPERVDELGLPVETVGPASHANLEGFADQRSRRSPPTAILGTDLTFEAIEPDGSPAAVDELLMDVIYDPPFESLSFRLEADNRRGTAINVELPKSHYSARAFITAKRATGTVVSSVPFVLTSRQFWDSFNALPLGATSFMAHRFVYKPPTGQVIAAATPITSTILGPEAGGTLVEVEAHFGAPSGQAAPLLTYSWSSPAASFDDATANVVRGVFAAGDNIVSVYACNDSGVCATASAHIDVPALSDTTPPAIYCPTGVTADGVDALGAVVWYPAPTATDDRDPSPAVLCGPGPAALFPYGTSLVTCTAMDASGNTASCSFQVTVRDVTPPVLQCPTDVRADGTGPLGATALFEHATATDNRDSNPIVICDRNPGETFGYGETLVTCSSVDSSGNSASCTLQVTIIDTPPALTLIGAGLMQAECGTTYAEPGFVAADARDGELTSSVEVTGLPSVGKVGSYSVVYSVHDASNNVAAATRIVVVVDTTPPRLDVQASPTTLWPPNHEMIPVQIAVLTADTCDPHPSVQIVSTTSNEPVGAVGSGNTSPDIEAAIGTAATEVRLRAERQGGGTGRIYTLTYRAKDASGNETTRAAEVSVPNSQAH